MVSHTNSFQAILAPLESDPVPDLTGEHGEVFTRRWVVEMILDLVDYTPDRDLAALRLVEPACGSGAFLRVIVERLVAACHRAGVDITTAQHAITAFDLLPENAAASHQVVVDVLVAQGVDQADAENLAGEWVRTGDYLLTNLDTDEVDLIVGNPPYIRLEDIPPARMAAYRRHWTTMGGRADVFVGFIERGLRSLNPGGKLGFICADRWMRNQYGRGLRELVADHFSVDVIVSMHDVDAFESDVSAYPAVTVLSNQAQGVAVVADTTTAFGPTHAQEIIECARGENTVVLPGARSYTLARLPHWFSGGDSWPQGSPERLAMIEHLTDNFPALEDAATGTKVGIGVATGADATFIVPGAVDVEDDRLLPLAMVKDLASGTLMWSGNFLVSPWQADGLVPLDRYPRLARYLDEHGEALRGRFVAKARPTSWYRTIDRVDVSLITRQKLYIPDMRLTLHPVLDTGETYPHHNLYTVTSDQWDLRVLGGLLLSRVATAFVEAFAVKMRGGTLRFQAQYLRRIRVPQLTSVSTEDAAALAAAFDARDIEAATVVALRLYGLGSMGEPA